MNPPTEAFPDSPLGEQAVAPAGLFTTRPMYWSLRRELWENRFVYIAPLIIAAVVLFGSLITLMIGLPEKMRAFPTLEPAQQSAVARPFSMAPAPIMLATFLVGIFYSLDALYGERRDRSILFWKSLPVSDRTTVLAKASIPLVVLPLIAFTLSVAAQIVMLVVSTALLLVNGLTPLPLWTEVRFFEGLPIMLYGLTVHALWFAPVYGWLLLVSAWARRATLLWSLMPLFAVSAVERVAFGTSHFVSMLQYRVTGAMKEAFAFHAAADGNIDRLLQLSPARFLSAPGLWIGLAFAAVFLASAVRLRRHREPI